MPEACNSNSKEMSAVHFGVSVKVNVKDDCYVIRVEILHNTKYFSNRGRCRANMKIEFVIGRRTLQRECATVMRGICNF